MGYVESNLLPNEQITYRARLHGIIYGLPATVLAAAVLTALGGGGWIAGAAIGAVGLVLLVPPWIRSVSSEFAVTDKRVLIKVGLIRRHSIELLLQKVEGIGVDQGILGRILGYGTITVSGVGGTKEAFRMISNPLEFRRQVQASLAT
ncbi:MAG TPA: PH domain-containing protein [Steroidobacteraceae bacterium]|nr:PH domain-containing protein [Steroidobacteraceae bacterium]